MDKIKSMLRQHSKKTITINELKLIIGEMEYSSFAEIVNILEKSNIIKPVISGGTNGAIPKLYLKYHILNPQKDYSIEIKEINALHPKFPISKFLSFPDRYRRVRSVIYPFSEYLKQHETEFEESMSENERAYSIWHNEKFLNYPENVSILREYELFELLNTYSIPEPFFEYRIHNTIKNILVVENKDTWFILRKCMLEMPNFKGIFGVDVDCIIYGEGKKVAQKNGALENYLLLDREFRGTVYYWGDLDYQGVDTYISAQKYNPSLNLQLLVPAYIEMLERFGELQRTAENKNTFRCHTAQYKPWEFSKFISRFDSFYAMMIENLLNENFYIPQEILNSQILKNYVNLGIESEA